MKNGMRNLGVIFLIMASAITITACGGGSDGGGGGVNTGTTAADGTLANPHILQLGQTYNITVMGEQLYCGSTFNLACPDFDKDYISTKFTVPADGSYRLSVTGVEPGSDAVLYIYQSASPSSTILNYVATVDNAGVGGSEIAVQDMPAGYYYYVFLQMWNGESTVQVKVEQITTPPAAPSNIGVSNVTQSSALLSWQDNSNNETGFEIGTCLLPGCSIVGCICSSFTKADQVGADVQSYQITGLTTSKLYTYAVRAYNDAGVSGNWAISILTP